MPNQLKIDIFLGYYNYYQNRFILNDLDGIIQNLQ